ncbi:MAG: SGNH/GDSL hydrolase family protein [Actinomycetota bacterium]|nr:SGNH/GDSL hydrolase family protein [Actinomycetota bacterium]
MRVFGLVVLVLALVLGVEVWLALRREYLPTDPPLELRGVFGPAGGAPLNFVVMGDSTSAGIGAGDAEHAYPTLLAERLAEATGRRVRLTVLGVSGARVKDVLNDQLPQLGAVEPDIVFIGIGANDVTHFTDLADIQADMKQILEGVTRLGTEVVVAGAPDMRVAAWLQPLRYLTYLRGKQVAAAIEEVARAQRVPVVELAEETGHFFAEEPAAHFSEDEFHPSALGYQRWADAIFPVLIRTVEG